MRMEAKGWVVQVCVGLERIGGQGVVVIDNIVTPASPTIAFTPGLLSCAHGCALMTAAPPPTPPTPRLARSPALAVPAAHVVAVQVRQRLLQLWYKHGTVRPKDEEGVQALRVARPFVPAPPAPR